MNTTSTPLLPIALTNDLSLIARLRLLLTFFRADLAVKPVDEWQLKTALLSFLHSPPLSLPSSPDDDDIIVIRRLSDLHKRRRGDPVASGCLVVRDISSLLKLSDEEEEELARKRFLEWRKNVVEKLEGIELNLQGVKFKMSVEVPLGDDFERMKEEWEEFYAAKLINARSSTRGAVQRPDTIIVSGVPSRWFAEPRVSSKASLLVTHTIFSVLGKIRWIFSF